MENVENKRLNNLDILKAICAFLVICIHISYKDKIGNIVTPLCRIAVPIFFMITGFFYYRTSKKPLRQIKKVLVLIILSNLLYFIFESIISGSPQIPSKEEIKESFLYNSSPFEFHLWYLNALLYVLIIAYITDKLKIRKFLYFLIPILLIINLIYGEYSIAVLNKNFDPIYMRNYLFVGLPYFLIGDLLYKNKDKIAKKIPTKSFAILIPLFGFTSIMEERILNDLGKDAIGEIYISTTFFAIAVFLLAIKTKQVNYQNIVAEIGRKYSTYIYIIHVMFINLFNKYVTINNNILNNTIQIIIFFASLLVAIMYVKTKNTIKIGWKKYNSITKKVLKLNPGQESD